MFAFAFQQSSYFLHWWYSLWHWKLWTIDDNVNNLGNDENEDDDDDMNCVYDDKDNSGYNDNDDDGNDYDDDDANDVGESSQF